MNNRRYLKSRIFLLRHVLILVSVTLLSACSGTDGGGSNELTCALSVFDHEGALIEAESTAFSQGDSVLDILLTAVQSAGLQIEYSGAGAAAYVQGINDLYEFDQGPTSGWIYTVNGEEILESAGAYKPNGGDVIVWQYVLDKSGI